jgi:uncharacterized protein (TIGR04255 family)
LAEFKFSQVLKIADYIPALQDKLRKKYPGITPRSEQGVTLQGNGIEIQSKTSWAFQSIDGRSAVQVSPESLTYFTSNYDRFGSFQESCREALSNLIEVVDPTLISRIGLRYSDLIVVDNGEKVEDLVDESFYQSSILNTLGLPIQKFSENIIKTSDGVLAIRSLHAITEATMLDNIAAFPIKIDVDSRNIEKVILDFDHFYEYEEAQEFALDVVTQKLSDLHSVSREAFWNITTDYARSEKWT